MKKRLLAVAAACAAATACLILSCVKPEDAARARIDAKVAELERKMDLPLSSGGLQAYRVSLDADPIYAAGTELIARAGKDRLLRLDLTAFGALGKIEDAYVFIGGELAWARQKSYRWSGSSAGMDAEKFQTWHFHSGRVIRMRDSLSGKTLGASAQLQDLGSALREEAGRLARLAEAAMRGDAGNDEQTPRSR